MRLVREEDLRPLCLGLRQQGVVLHHEGRAFPLVGLEQALLQALVDEAQPVQVARAGAAAQSDPVAGLDELAHHLPVPVRQRDADFRRGGRPAPPLSAPPGSRGRGRRRDRRSAQRRGRRGRHDPGGPPPCWPTSPAPAARARASARARAVSARATSGPVPAVRPAPRAPASRPIVARSRPDPRAASSGAVVEAGRGKQTQPQR
jgi:hypothetical protein